MQFGESSAIVTGGASGLGFSTAQRLVRRGVRVVVVDLPDAQGTTTRADAVASLGEDTVFVPGDVRDPDVAATAVERAATAERGRKRRPLRVLVNCAGVADPGKLLSKRGPLSYEAFMHVLSINAGGTVNFMTHAAEAMAGEELDGEDRGVIVNTASVAAYDGQIGQIAYSASKGGVASLTLPAARELAASQIRVMTIAPGVFETPMVAGLPDAARESLSSKTPHPARLGQPADYSLLVEQIIENPMLNGEVIRLDGAVRLEPR